MEQFICRFQKKIFSYYYMIIILISLVTQIIKKCVERRSCIDHQNCVQEKSVQEQVIFTFKKPCLFLINIIYSSSSSYLIIIINIIIIWQKRWLI